MRFVVIDRGHDPNRESGILVLQYDNWDDYGFRTTFCAYYKNEAMGVVKIGYRNMPEGEITFGHLQKSFDKLPEEFFSLWQSEESYEKLKSIEDKEGERIFEPLRDIAYDLRLFDEFANEPSLQMSLLRSVSVFACKGQLHRIATGGSKLIEYHFEYKIAFVPFSNDISIAFDVNPDDYPPSNIHALIGRNGIGKTRLIQDFICSVCGQTVEGRDLSFKISPASDNQVGESTFANAICVAFSPFDDYKQVLKLTTLCDDNLISPSRFAPHCSYIGLDRDHPNLLTTIELDFIGNFKECFANRKKEERWMKAMDILASDPAFSNACENLVNNQHKSGGSRDIQETIAQETFQSLSSGHKVVLAIITSCVNRLEERSIVFIDEPENHLHPPLLASLIQALSFLLIDRNSVAIISTHSPVVLQGIPRTCTWILNRFGEFWRADRPKIETFGANFESLTSQVFGYEVSNSGFHRMLQDAVDESNSLSEAINRFHGSLGDEADALIRILWVQKEDRER